MEAGVVDSQQAWSCQRRRSPRGRPAPWLSPEYEMLPLECRCQCGISKPLQVVRSVVVGLDVRKCEIVRSIGFGGLLEFPELTEFAGTTISARRAAVISAMIDDVTTATAAEGKPRACRRKRRMASARGYKQEGRRLRQDERGVVVVRARHRTTGQVVAVKSLHRSGGSYVGVSATSCARPASWRPAAATLRSPRSAPSRAVPGPRTTPSSWTTLGRASGPSWETAATSRSRRPRCAASCVSCWPAPR
ncbi:unnamed protein product [Urochloa humidicola]